MSSHLEPSSHGRGGAGNIAKDDTEYVDGGIVRTATPSGTYTTGRGGGGNIGHSENSTDGGHDIVPENAQHEQPLPSHNHGISTGRGGGGNIVTSEGEDGEHKGIADKLKDKLFSHHK